MFSLPVYVVALQTRGEAPLLSSVAAKQVLANLLKFYHQTGRFYLLAYCVHPRGVRLLLKPGPGYEFLSALEALKRNSEQLVLKQLAREGKVTAALWHALYEEKTINSRPVLAYELDQLRYLPVRMGLVKHPADYQFCQTQASDDLDLALIS